MLRVEFHFGYDSDKGRPEITYKAMLGNGKVVGPVFSIGGLIKQCGPQYKSEIIASCEKKLATMGNNAYSIKVARAIERARQA